MYSTICLRFLSSVLVIPEVFLNSRLSSTRLLINWFLIKKTCIQMFVVILLHHKAKNMKQNNKLCISSAKSFSK